MINSFVNFPEMIFGTVNLKYINFVQYASAYCYFIVHSDALLMCKRQINSV